MRDERMELTEEESKTQAKLLTVMREHKLHKYKLDDGRVVEVEEGEAKVKVRKPREKAQASL